MESFLAGWLTYGTIAVGTFVCIAAGISVVSLLVLAVSCTLWKRLKSLHDFVVLRHYIRELAKQGKLWSLKPEGVEGEE
jgi:uncharacterized membrane protein YqjE